jgi:hypothetical protein
MDFEKIIKALKGIHFVVLRSDDAGYFEAVITGEQLQRLIGQLDFFFGKAVFPSKNKLTSGILRDINAFGGIMPGQTLYYSRGNDGVIFAMLWPWQDKEHITIKIVKK